jgi:hypothetical protein
MSQGRRLMAMVFSITTQPPCSLLKTSRPGQSLDGDDDRSGRRRRGGGARGQPGRGVPRHGRVRARLHSRFAPPTHPL